MSSVLQFFTKALSVVLSVLLSFIGSVTGMWTEQHKSLESITKVADNYYLMDYTYDYDLDTLLNSKSGNSTTVGMLLYSFADVFACVSFEPIFILALYISVSFLYSS